MNEVQLRVGWTDPATGDVHDTLVLREPDGADEDLMSVREMDILVRIVTIVGRCIESSRGSTSAPKPAPVTPRSPRLHNQLAAGLVLGDLYFCAARLGALMHGKRYSFAAHCSACGTKNNLVTNALELGASKVPPKLEDGAVPSLFDPYTALIIGTGTYTARYARDEDGAWRYAAADKATHVLTFRTPTRSIDGIESYLTSDRSGKDTMLENRRRSTMLWGRLVSMDCGNGVVTFTSSDPRFDATKKPLIPESELDAIQKLPTGLRALARETYGSVEDVSWDYDVPYVCKKQNCPSPEQLAEVVPIAPFFGPGSR